MIGGEKQVFERCEPLLKDLSVSLRHVGTPAQSAQIKALVNMVMNIEKANMDTPEEYEMVKDPTSPF